MIARILALVLLWTGIAAADVPVPVLSARVTDLTDTLDVGQEAALESRLEHFELEQGSQIAVLIVPTTQPEAIEQYAIRVAEAWKIGRKGVDDGVILLVAKEDRAVRIEVGYGLEGALPDVIAKRITEEVILPRFRAADFYGGISVGVDRIIGVIQGEPLPPPPDRPRGISGPSVESLWLALFVPMVLGAAIRRLHNRLSGGLVAGGLAGGLGWWLTQQSLVALVAALTCGFLILVTNERSGRGRWSSRGGGWGGGGFGGGGGFSGGGGGFSGGGGGFGGGGASGRW